MAISILVYSRKTQDRKYTGRELDKKLQAIVRQYNDDYATNSEIANYIRNCITDLAILYDNCAGYYEWRSIITKMVRDEIAERRKEYVQ